MAFDDMRPQPPTVEGMLTAGTTFEDYPEHVMALSRAAAGTCRMVGDIAFGDDYHQKLDVYLPADESLTALPVHVYIHGGGWQWGFKEWGGFMAPAIVELPAVYVSVSYRLAPEHKYPACLDDCLDAVAWVWREIASFGGDPERIFLSGHSAGGHLSALTTLRRDLVEARGLPRDVIKACFPVSGIYDMDSSDPPPGSSERKISEILFADASDESDASPINFVDGNTTPFYLTYGSRDYEKAIRNGVLFIAALARQPGKVGSYVFEGLGHHDASLELRHRDCEWMKVVRSWMSGG